MKLKNYPQKGQSFINFLFQPTDATSYCIFRFLAGLTFMYQAFIIFNAQYVHDNFVAPKLLFTFGLFEWLHLPRWSAPMMQTHFFMMAIASIGVAFGIFFRTSLVIFTTTFTYAFIIEKSIFNNHYYLMIIFCIIFFFSNPQQMFSIDAKRKERQTSAMPFWPLFLMRFQLCIVYFYGAIAKINYDWLFRAEPMLMRFTEDKILFNQSVNEIWVAYFFSYGGFFLDLFAGIFLFLGLFLKPLFVGIVFFNVMNNYLFGAEIGIFPFFMLSALILFLDPAKVGACVEKWTKQKENTPMPKIAQSRKQWIRWSIIIFMLIQILLPLRHFLYPGNVRWTFEGYRFSWRMKLDIRYTKLKFFVTNPKTGEQFEYKEFKQDLSELQLLKAGVPDMILQYTHFLKEQLEAQGIKNPIINVHASTQLNGKPYKPIIDPTVNLANEKYPLFGHAKWIYTE